MRKKTSMYCGLFCQAESLRFKPILRLVSCFIIVNFFLFSFDNSYARSERPTNAHGSGISNLPKAANKAGVQKSIAKPGTEVAGTPKVSPGPSVAAAATPPGFRRTPRLRQEPPITSSPRMRLPEPTPVVTGASPLRIPRAQGTYSPQPTLSEPPSISIARRQLAVSISGTSVVAEVPDEVRLVRPLTTLTTPVPPVASAFSPYGVSRLPTTRSGVLRPQLRPISATIKPITLARLPKPKVLTLSRTNRALKPRLLLKSQSLLPKMASIAKPKMLPMIKSIINPLRQVKPIAALKLRPITMVKITQPRSLPALKPIGNSLKNLRPIATPSLRPITTLSTGRQAIKITQPKLLPTLRPIINPFRTLRPIVTPSLRPITMVKIAQPRVLSTLKPIGNSLKNLRPIATPSLRPITMVKIAQPKPLSALRPINSPLNNLRPIAAPSLRPITMVKIAQPRVLSTLKPIGNSLKNLRPIAASSLRPITMVKIAQPKVLPALRPINSPLNNLRPIAAPSLRPITMVKIAQPKVLSVSNSLTSPFRAIKPIPQPRMLKLVKLRPIPLASSRGLRLRQGFGGQAAGRVIPEIKLVKLNTKIRPVPENLPIKAPNFFREDTEAYVVEEWKEQYEEFVALSEEAVAITQERGKVDIGVLSNLDQAKADLNKKSQEIVESGILEDQVSGQWLNKHLIQEQASQALRVPLPQSRSLPLGAKALPQAKGSNAIQLPLNRSLLPMRFMPGGGPIGLSGGMSSLFLPVDGRVKIDNFSQYLREMLMSLDGYIAIPGRVQTDSRYTK